MRVQVDKHTDMKCRWMTAERTLFVSVLGLAILITNYGRPVVKVESMVLATESCPDCGSNRHRSC